MGRASHSIATLIAADMALIGAYLLCLAPSGDGLAAPRPLDLSAGESIASVVLYAKWLGATIVLARSGAPALRAMAVFLGALLADDLLELHEMAGDALGLAPRFGLASDDVGELVAMAALGVLCLGCLIVAFRRAEAMHVPWLCRLAAAIAFLAVCGVAGDMAHARLEDAGDWTRRGLVVLGDGGELLAGTLILSVALRAAAAGGGRAARLSSVAAE